MTPVERYERFAGRVEAIRNKGFKVSEETMLRSAAGRHRLLPLALPVRVCARDNRCLSLLG